MIQFNLLPDVKVEYVKTQRTKRLVIGSALIATASAFVIFLLLLIAVQGVQRKSISDLDKDIATYSSELQATPDLDKILTIQNQLSALDGLHGQKVVAARMFAHIQQVTPTDVTIADHTVDFTASTMTITGQAPSFDRVNVLVDTLKFATFETGGEENAAKAFSGVVLSEFGRNDNGSSYSISLNFDPTLFSNDSEVKLIIPQNFNTTRSMLGQPTDIFKSSVPEQGGAEQ